MNVLFYILPLVNPLNEEEPEQGYLKVIDIQNADEVTHLLQNVFVKISYVDYERFEGFYDQRRLNGLINTAKQLSPRRKYPETDRILALFGKKKFTSYQSVHNHLPLLNINGIDVPDGIINASICADTSVHALVNPGFLTCAVQAIRVVDNKHNLIPIDVIDCESQDLYKWFVNNRDPKRELDQDYKKHTKAPRNGFRGIISPLTYSKKQTENFLKKAIGAENAKTLFLMDSAKNKIIVFWNENLSGKPTYHAYEVSGDDASELDKIYRKGGRSLVDKLNDHAEY